jgi:UDP-3-O-[3-hydroxymyristoyl] glucosamine N-acyltransferase
MNRQKKYSLSEISQLISLPFEGDPNVIISGVGTLQQASEHQITFLDNPRYRKYLTETKAGAVILSAQNKKFSNIPVFISNNPYLDFAKILRLFDERSLPDIGIHSTAIIGKDCKIDPTARIGAYCIIGDHCEIGAESCLWPRVTLYDSTSLGARVIVHSGAVLGSDGFGNARDGMKWVKVPQLGRVEIGANTTIDRGALDDTIIEDGVRIDNQVQIAHNVKIGAHTAIAGCVGIAGSTTIGKYCMVGGGTGINGHIDICDGVMLAGMTGVTKSITEPGIYASVISAQKHLAWRKMAVRLRHLDELFERVERLEKLEKS